VPHTDSTPATTGGRRMIARIATEALAPYVWLIAMPYAISWLGTHDLGRTLAWGTLLTVTGSVIPMGVILYGAKRGKYDSHHVNNREGRLVPILVALVSQILGLVVLILADTPVMMPALTAGLVAVGFFSLAITVGLRWKISLHSAGSAGSVVLLVIGYGWWPAVLIPLVALVSWSRVELRHHTAQQVLAGVLLGVVAAGAGYWVADALLA
jgi:membrane-associated phospholipid phosphatase